ncbi:hypothetical protein DYB32_009276 [Aphanomyces invadans]|uniref:Uncharacterized protein n=1 Tax=Aphanomyces invadans TaxID=157072 RepID=A0A3R6ZIT5_9STRA|nr:hypothetical protein DYB32_009276 [Aphanomyces invadans]
MDKRLQERLTSHVAREHVAKMRIRDDLVKLASSTASTAADQLKDMLMGLAADAVANSDKPRGHRHGLVLTCLPKQFQDDAHPVVRKARYAKDVYIDVFRAQVNARDMKGWTPIAIAVFHHAKKTARLLLQHGANPRLKNQSTLENNRNKFAVGAAEPLPSDGGATLLAIEVAMEAQHNAAKKKSNRKKAIKTKHAK